LPIACSKYDLRTVLGEQQRSRFTNTAARAMIATHLAFDLCHFVLTPQLRWSRRSLETFVGKGPIESSGVWLTDILRAWFNPDRIAFFITTGLGRPRLRNVTVGPSGQEARAAQAHMQPVSTVRVPWKLLRSVAVNPGHAELTLMPADSRSAANATVSALRAVFDDE
jgi:hypothetical protein